MASKEWNNEASNDDDGANNGGARSLFIDRNPNRFGYILDFMRDGKVILAGGQGGNGTSKTSMLEELTYFGFENVPSNAVRVEFSMPDLPKYVARMDEEFESERDAAIAKRDQLNIEISAMVVAHACAVRRLTTGSSTVEFNILEGEGEPRYDSVFKPKKQCAENILDFQAIRAIEKTGISEAELNDAMTKYGLRATRLQWSRDAFRDPNYSHKSHRHVWKLTVEIHSTFAAEW